MLEKQTKKYDSDEIRFSLFQRSNIQYILLQTEKRGCFAEFNYSQQKIVASKIYPNVFGILKGRIWTKKVLFFKFLIQFGLKYPETQADNLCS